MFRSFNKKINLRYGQVVQLILNLNLGSVSRIG